MKKITIAAAFLGLVGSANAIIVIDTLSENYPGTELVLFNDPSLLPAGPLVQGMTDPSRVIVNWSEAEENLITGDNQVMAVDGSFTRFSVAMDDPTLGIAAFQFNPTALGNGNIKISVFEAGVFSHGQIFYLSDLGPKTFRIYGTENEVFSSIYVYSEVELSDLSRNRVSAVPNPVPEPAAFIALGIGLTGLLVRKRFS